MFGCIIVSLSVCAYRHRRKSRRGQRRDEEEIELLELHPHDAGNERGTRTTGKRLTGEHILEIDKRSVVRNISALLGTHQVGLTGS